MYNETCCYRPTSENILQDSTTATDGKWVDRHIILYLAIIAHISAENKLPNHQLMAREGL